MHLSSLDFVQVLLNQLAHLGVREVCVCPGKRNAFFIQYLLQNPRAFRIFSFFEERSAAFFALGRIQNTQNPVAVITTSGTAAAELLPATIEAYYLRLPLILVTADRPKRFRGSGAPQCIEQVGLFGIYAPTFFDWDCTEISEISKIEKLFLNTPAPLIAPCHLNICFEESFAFLKEKKSYKNSYSNKIYNENNFFEKMRAPLVIVGGLRKKEREKVVQILLAWRAPVYLESLSGIREDPRIQEWRIHLPDRILERAAFSGYQVDSVIRVGGVPILRFWRDLEEKYSDLPVFSLSSSGFSGLSRACFQMDLALFFEKKEHPLFLLYSTQEHFHSATLFLKKDFESALSFQKLLKQEPLSEVGMIAALSERIPRYSRVYLGNSLPIREWDLGSTYENRNYEIYASRGANGIDGQVSTFLGFADSKYSNWAFLGDLTALYDLSGPSIVSPRTLSHSMNLFWQEELKNLSASIVVINNGGGKIFSRMFEAPEFQNSHTVCFKSWADLWGLSYEKWSFIPESSKIGIFSPDLPCTRIIELVPDSEATKRFWEGFEVFL